MKLVDLFSGCGGFSLGAHQAGFRVTAAVDNDPILASSYPLNFPNTRLILKDLRTLSGDDLRAAIGAPIDGVFGGPPCQGFSDIGKREPEDARRQLVGHFFRIVRELRPAFFVMENVRGLAYSGSRDVLSAALQLVRDYYDIFGPEILDASEFGAATKRARLFVIGINKDRGEPLTLDDIAAFRRPPATVRAAISDLQRAVPLGEENGFDVWRIAGGVVLRSMSGTCALQDPASRAIGEPHILKRLRLASARCRPVASTPSDAIPDWNGLASARRFEPVQERIGDPINPFDQFIQRRPGLSPSGGSTTAGLSGRAPFPSDGLAFVQNDRQQRLSNDRARYLSGHTRENWGSRAR